MVTRNHPVARSDRLPELDVTSVTIHGDFGYGLEARTRIVSLATTMRARAEPLKAYDGCGGSGSRALCFGCDNPEVLGELPDVIFRLV